MADREKVIKAIETHISTDDSVGCDDCTYENDGWCMTKVLTDALALLKEQDNEIDNLKTLLLGYETGAIMKEQKIAMKPKNIDKVGGDCPVCGSRMARIQKYCYRCGQEVMWE